MLTRLEVDGFKNLVGFVAEFGPFTCIAGANGVGKSNIFDVIRFLSLLTERTIMEAAQQIRDADANMGNLRDLFWTDGKEHRKKFSIAAEMLVEKDVVDDFGRPAEASSSFLRYEIEIGWQPADKDNRLERLVLRKESLTYITKSDAAERLRFPHSAKEFRNSVVFNKRRVLSGYISTHVEQGQTEILVHQEGESSGRPQRSSANNAPRTIVGTSNTSATPTILAARREMQKWQILALEPSAMRGVDRLYAQQTHIGANGAHLPATLFRLVKEAEKQGDDPAKIYARIANRLAQFVSIRNVRIDEDPVRQLLTLEVQESLSSGYLPARSLSDGTLRFLTLCILAEDTEARGLICLEEPENGIHPAKMEAMVTLLHDLAVDPQERVGASNPLRQIIVASHSPLFVQLQNPDELLFARSVKTRMKEGAIANVLRCQPLGNRNKPVWRVTEDNPGVSLDTMLAYLTTPPNAQIKLFLDETGV